MVRATGLSKLFGELAISRSVTDRINRINKIIKGHLCNLRNRSTELTSKSADGSHRDVRLPPPSASAFIRA